TLSFAKELDLDLFQLSISTPYPGTQLYRYAVAQNLLVHTEWTRYGQGEVLVRIPGLSAEEIYAFERRAFRSFYLRPRLIMRQLRRITSWRHLRDLALGFATLILGTLLYRNPRWDCWRNIRETEFQDLPVRQPAAPRLTYV